MSQESLNLKIRFLGLKVYIDRHESEYRGHHFRVSRFFPSTYHQGSVKKMLTQKRGLEISTKSI